MKYPRDPWTLIAGVSVVYVIGFIPGTFLGFIVGGLIDSGFDRVEAGGLGTVEGVSLGAVMLLAAPFMARVSAVRVAVAGVLLAGLGQLSSALLDSYWALAGARLSSGIGAGLALTAVTAAGAASRDPNRVYGFGLAGYMALICLLTPALAKSIGSAGITGGFVLLGCAVFASLPVLGWLGHTSRETVLVGSQQTLPRRELLLLLAVTILSMLAGSPTLAFQERIGANIGLEVEQIGEIFLLGTFAGFGGSVLAGWLGLRWGRTRPLLLTLLAFGASCVGFGYASSEAFYLAMMMLWWASNLFLYTSLMAMAAAIDPAGRLGPAAAGSWMLVVGFGPLLGSFLIEAASYPAVGWWAAALLGVTILLVVLKGAPLDRLGTSSAAR